ncbi:hypothetical protein AYI70_g8783 [Smittium culicis]|uniref:Uncharacterized protein n=1 Tax=Smittium culicis TaxID=133412 RepID=A0A1R1XEG4_9FUNG|nr:hypothetical protein AYI70_g8783 [Smittium culicis]
MEPLSNQGDLDGVSIEESEERKALGEVVSAFLFYKFYALKCCVENRLKNIDLLNPEDRSMVLSTGVLQRIFNIKNMIETNYEFILELIGNNEIILNSGLFPMPENFDQNKDSFLEVLFLLFTLYFLLTYLRIYMFLFSKKKKKKYKITILHMF